MKKQKNKKILKDLLLINPTLPNVKSAQEEHNFVYLNLKNNERSRMKSNKTFENNE